MNIKTDEWDGCINEFYKSVGDEGIHGHITREVYNQYVDFCKVENARITRGIIDFSRQIVKRFNYKVIDRKITGKKRRIFKHQLKKLSPYKQVLFNDSFLDEISIDEIENQPTNKVYKRYQEHCEGKGIKPISNIAFSKMVKRKFGVRIVDRKIKGVKYRIFVKSACELS